MFGWKVAGHRPTQRKYLIVGAHHTSNWDFPLAVLFVWAMGINWHFVAKDSLFRPPFGRLFRALGGIPVDRKRSTNFTGQVIELFDKTEDLVIAISPEGTREKTTFWRTGFYIIACGARIPIALAYLDYASHTIGFGPTIYPGGDLAADLEKIRAFYDGVTGKFPHNQGRIEVKPGYTNSNGKSA